MKHIRVKVLLALVVALVFIGAVVGYFRSDAITRLQIRGFLGDQTAQMKLGSLYLQGEEIEGGVGIYHHQDFEQAIRWYKMAANSGSKIAQYWVGIIYSGHYGWPPGDVEAAKWFRLSADQGYAPAQYELGALYQTGEGLGKDSAQCVYWYRKGALQGYPLAELCLGGRYEDGDGVPKDMATAFAWYKKAAQGGVDEGAGFVWKMYLYGDGIEKDEPAAKAWYRLWSGDKDVTVNFPLNRQFTIEETQRSDALYKELKDRIKIHDDTEPWPLWPG